MRAPQEIAAEMRKSDEWNPELCAELCEAAGMSTEWNAADGENFESVVFSAARKMHVQIISNPVLFINEKPADFTGWNFNLESGSRIFIPFTNIKLFRSSGILEITTFSGMI